MMFSVWNTAVASSRFKHDIGKFIHAFICRIYGVYGSPACWEPPCGRREGAGALRERGLGGGFPTLPTACGSG